MKNLKSLGKILNKAQQKQIVGSGGNELIRPPRPCLTNEDCSYQTGDYSSICNAGTGRCIVFN